VGEFVVPFEGQRQVPYTVKLTPRSGEEPDKGKKK
jgi:hypothetical protein